MCYILWLVIITVICLLHLNRIPGRTSVLIQGFPLKDGEELKYQIVMGYATEWVRQKKAYVVDSFRSYLMDMSTPAYREKMSTKLPGGVGE